MVLTVSRLLVGVNDGSFVNFAEGEGDGKPDKTNQHVKNRLGKHNKTQERDLSYLSSNKLTRR